MYGNILIIDDDSDMREALARALKDLGYQTQEAEVGEKGIQRFIQDSSVEALSI
jgi:CheY-like chemotaxis protein